MDELDRLRRENQELRNKSRLPGRAAEAGTGIVKGLIGAAGHFIPRGGLQHPDSAITRGSNRGLYLPSGGHPVSPVPGMNPRMNKELLTGSPKSAPKPKPSRRRRPPARKNTYAEQMKRARRMILG